ncbi:DUF4276 family protein [Actinomyces capricornis]|uniref:DUF4276 family protein n=1 Tax=Actinomyces capricornis TaxID=2755559 RepID=A0ABN6K3V9_9ACTO|nr:DUF4276 family protein [Actinomyces capricornis]BDA64255.1 hypothetical protein MANAM107_10890 [Actinomyces capricornis]
MSPVSPLSEVVIVVEGQTEETLIKETLSPIAAMQGVFLTPIVVRTSATQHGGGHWRGYHAILRQLLAQRHWKRIGLLLDYYGYPLGAPGRDGFVPGATTWTALVESLTRQYRDPRFLPLVIPHEIETLVLAAIDAGAGEGLLGASALKALRQAITQAGSVEAVNSHPDLSPSKRLKRADGDYSKTVTGPLLIGEAGLPAVLERCPAFAGWWERILA